MIKLIRENQDASILTDGELKDLCAFIKSPDVGVKKLALKVIQDDRTTVIFKHYTEENPVGMLSKSR